MRSILLPAAILITAASPARATDALFFNGGGYCIEVLVGHNGSPAVAQILFTPPKTTSWASLPAAQVRIEKFNLQQQVLIIHFTNQGNPDLPQSFSLSVQKVRGTLQINGKRIKGKFDWST